MNRFNQPWVTQNFGMTGLRLARKTARGYKKAGCVRSNTLYVMYQGKEYHGAALAWYLQTGAWPEFPVVSASGDPTNLALDNLLPITGVNFRMIVSQVGADWSHNLSRYLFPSEHQAQLNWYIERLKHYNPGKLTIAEKDARDAMRYRLEFQGVDVRQDEFSRQLSDESGRPGRTLAPRRRPSVPKAIPGKKWHFYEDAWVLTDEPCHLWDDYVVRAHSFKYLKAERMKFSEELNRVVCVTTLTKEDVRIHKLNCPHKYCKALPVEHV